MGRMMDPTDEEGEFEPTAIGSADPEPGDANGDTTVDFADFLILSANYGRDEDVAFADGDFNSDGVVNFADFLILSQNFRGEQQVQ